MFEKKVQEYLDRGILKKEEVGLELIERLLREAVIDIDEAQKTQEIGAHRATFFLSCMAMLRGGRALLLLKGYRPSNSSQHRTIVEMTSLILGNSSKNIISHFEGVLKKEDDLIHGGQLLSEIEAHDAFHYALLLLREIVKIIKVKDPEFHVTF